jgi:hypothetical protein
MPPEQVRGSTDVSPPADVYALGASLYECLAHRPPFSAGDRETLYRSILRDEPPDLRRFNQHVSRSLWAVVLRCLAKDPARRYHDGADLATELEALRAGMRVRARLPGPARHAARWLRRHPVAALLLVVSGLMATIAMLLAWQSNERVRAQAMAIVSGSAALDEVNPVAGALLAREAYRAADTFATRSRLLAALANLAQVGEVDFGKTVGWAGVSPDGKCVAAGVLPWAPLPEAPMIQGPWRLALSGRGHAGAWSGDGTRFALHRDRGRDDL